MDVLWGLGGIALLLIIAVLLSADRRKIKPRTVILALLVQLGFGALVLYVPAGQRVLEAVSSGVQSVINSSAEGIGFLFGPILPEEGSVFAFQVLPVIVFFAALTSVLYYLGILQLVTKWLGGGLAKLLGTTGPESMNAAANIFVGQTEAPLVIKPYIKNMTASELFAVMCGGLATVAGSVLVGYSLMGANLEYLIAASFMAAPAGLLFAKLLVPAGALAHLGPNATEPAPRSEKGHKASKDDDAHSRATDGEQATSADDDGLPTSPHADPKEVPGAKKTGLFQRFARGGRRGASKESVNELAGRGDSGAEGHAGAAPAQSTATATGEEHRDGEPETVEEEEGPVNVVDAAARGASDGLSLALNVGAMLLAFVSLIALLNLILGGIGGWFGYDELSIQQVLGYVFSPIMAGIGVPLNEAVDAGSFLGQKVVLNEFVAFADFAPRAEEFTEKTQAIVTFALTGFANIGSFAILLGGLGGIAPTQRSVIAKLGMRAILAGTLANLMSAAIAGILIN